MSVCITYMHMCVYTYMHYKYVCVYFFLWKKKSLFSSYSFDVVLKNILQIKV